MTIALLATGDEIINGDVLNTNGHYIARTVSSEGLMMGLHLTVGDSEAAIHECIQFLANNHEVIIITGGLGPTSDDRTRFALARFMNTPLVAFPEAIQHIETHLRRIQTLSQTPANQQQTLFPKQASLLANPFGTAMGCICVWQEKLFILLPGPPRECLPMFNDWVLPVLQKRTRSTKIQLKWLLFGVAESQIAHLIDTSLSDLDCETGYRLEIPYVECKVRCEPELVEEVNKRLTPLIAPHLLTPSGRASDQLKATLAEKPRQISINDHVTGGLLQSVLQRPDNFSFLHFNPAQPAPYHFELNGLDEYWKNCAEKTEASVRIHYSLPDLEGEEQNTLPFRSPLVVNLATEWICFRILQRL